MNATELKSLKVGDEVTYAKIGYSKISDKKSSRIKSISKTGRITLENGEVFNNDGWKRGADMFNVCRIIKG